MPSVADASIAKLVGLGYTTGTLMDKQVAYLQSKTGSVSSKTYADMYKEFIGSPVQDVIPESKIV